MWIKNDLVPPQTRPDVITVPRKKLGIVYFWALESWQLHWLKIWIFYMSHPNLDLTIGIFQTCRL